MTVLALGALGAPDDPRGRVQPVFQMVNADARVAAVREGGRYSSSERRAMNLDEAFEYALGDGGSTAIG